MMFEPIFPGMDPFIEEQKWPRFHNALISRIADELSRLLVPLYSVDSEGYIYLGMRPDIYISKGKPGSEPFEQSNIPIAEKTRLIVPTFYDIDEQLHVSIRDEDGRLVTIIEVLSPSNKTTHRSRYLANRNAILETKVHLIEIDLLRSGKRLEPDLSEEGYAILIARAQKDSIARGELYEIGLRDPLPVIPVPLKPDDADVPLDLPRLFKSVYMDGRYRYQLDYTRFPAKSFTDVDAVWVKQRINQPPL